MNADLLKRLIEAGTPAHLVAEVAMEFGRAHADAEALEKRRRKDRERKANVPRNSTESAESEESSEKAELVPPSPDGPSLFPQTPNSHPLNPPSTSNDTGGATGEILPFPKTKGRKSKADRATTLPADFTLTAARIAFAREEGLTDEAARRQFAKFTASAEAHGRKYVNWGRAWENWVRTSIDGFGPARGSSPGGYGTSSGGRIGAMQRALARVSNPYDVSE